VFRKQFLEGLVSQDEDWRAPKVQECRFRGHCKNYTRGRPSRSHKNKTIALLLVKIDLRASHAELSFLRERKGAGSEGN